MTTRSLLALAALPLTLSACSGGQTADAAAPVVRGVPVRTARVESRDIDETLVLTGTLKPRAQVQLVAELQARLVKVVRDEGARVQAGEVLAVLDATDYRLSNDRAKAALAVAEANRSHALAERERAQNLLKTGGITAKDSLAAEVALQVAEASVAQVKAEAAIVAQQLARTEIRAPFAGRVARRLADPGAMLANGTPVFTFVDDSVLEFKAPVPSAHYGKAKVGAPVDVQVDALGVTGVKGRLARVSPLVEERTRSFDTEVEGGIEQVVRTALELSQQQDPAWRRRSQSRPMPSWRPGRAAERRFVKWSDANQLTPGEEATFTVAAIGPVGHVYLAKPLDEKNPEAILVDMTNNENQRQLIGAIVPRGGQWYFFKLLGDGAAVAPQKDAFTKFVQTSNY